VSRLFVRVTHFWSLLIAYRLHDSASIEINANIVAPPVVVNGSAAFGLIGLIIDIAIAAD
jgi:hypothetical protein